MPVMRTAGIRRLFVVPILACVPLIAKAESQWMEIKSPNFSVVTDAGEKRGREVAMRFEQMRAVFASLMVKANVNLPVPLQIVAFRNTKEIRQFTPLWHGKPIEVAGYFQSGFDRSFIMLDMSAANPWQVVFHEYAHQLMNGALSRQLDPWFEEGFAEYFSSIEVDDKEARVGKPTEYAYSVLRQNAMMKIPDLFRVQQNSATYNESGDHRSVFYAESDMVVHYLYDHQAISKATAYFNLRLDDVPLEEAIQKAFGMTGAQFDKELREYIQSGRSKYYVIPTPTGIDPKSYSAAQMSPEDSSAVMADAHLHLPQYRDKAVTEFQEILKDHPDNAAANRGLGYAYLQKSDFRQAAEYFHRASQLNSRDPRVHYYSALLLSRQNGFGPEMIHELETAISLDPNFADSYMLLGFAQNYSGQHAQGLETMRKAVALSPRNEGYQYNLAQMYISNRQFEDALALLQVLEKTSNPELAARVRQSLMSLEQIKLASQRNGADRDSAHLIARSASDNEPAPSDEHPSTSELETPSEPQPSTAPQAPPNPHPTKFMPGLLASIDCASPPGAVLTVLSAGKTWKLTVADVNHMILFGADKFSCSWAKRKVSLNYRETGAGEGSVVSLEIQ